MYSSKTKLTGPEMDTSLKKDREEREIDAMSISLPGEKVKQILNFILIKSWNTEALEYLLSNLDNGEKIMDYLSQKEFEAIQF